MASAPATVLFLCTGNHYRSRFAEVLFNHMAERLGLSWLADSRGLALERGAHNVGPMSRAAVARLQALGVAVGVPTRLPLQATADDFARAGQIIALKEEEHRPLLAERFPGWEDRVEYWHIHDVDCWTPAETLAGIEREVLALARRLGHSRNGS
jgi:protein-tyrosine phosphatase